MEMAEPFTGILKGLVGKVEEQFSKGEINSIDYEKNKRNRNSTQKQSGARINIRTQKFTHCDII